jgi:folate-binding protein YgfZ
MVDLSEEYRTALTGAGWRLDDRRGRLRVTGRDATTYLHALVTADMAAVPAGGGVYTAYLSPQGRMITDFAAYRVADGWLLDVPPGMATPLLAKLDSMIFAEDVQLADVTAEIALVSVTGARAAEIAGEVLRLPPSRLAQLAVRETVEAEGVLIARTDSAAWITFDLFVARAGVDPLTAQLSAVGATPVSDVTFETLRVEAGRPAFGVDMTAETIPLEAGLLDRAISQSKGCYVGQEVIVRVLHRGGGRVAKRLMQIEATGAEPILAGTVISVDGRDVGVVTSAVSSPARGRSLALGYVHRDFAHAGQALVAGTVPATIIAAAG